jgi:hypothetical protein
LGLANGCRLPQKTISEILVGSLYWNIFLARRAMPESQIAALRQIKEIASVDAKTQYSICSYP